MNVKPTMKRLHADNLPSSPSPAKGKGLDRATFEALYQRHGRRAKGFFLRMMDYDEALADDLTQELFLRIWKHRGEYNADSSFETWLFTIAYNLCKNEYRHQNAVRSCEEALSQRPEPCTDPVRDLERKEQKALIRQAVQHLPEGQREAFILRYEEDLPLSDVAAILAIPEGTVKSRLFNALNAVRKALNDNE